MNARTGVSRLKDVTGRRANPKRRQVVGFVSDFHGRRSSGDEDTTHQDSVS